MLANRKLETLNITDRKVLKSFSTKELKTEIEKRKKKKPKLLMERHRDVISFEKIGGKYLDEIINNEGMIDSDMEHYVFEAALEYLYGKEIWKWVIDMEVK